MSKRECYAQLFGEFGASLSDADWIALANDLLPPNLSALNARIVKGSRTDRLLQVTYQPGPESFTFFNVSGGCIAEMPDQAAAHCGTSVTSCGLPNNDDDDEILACGYRQRICRHNQVVGRDKRRGDH